MLKKTDHSNIQTYRGTPSSQFELLIYRTGGRGWGVTYNEIQKKACNKIYYSYRLLSKLSALYIKKFCLIYINRLKETLLPQHAHLHTTKNYYIISLPDLTIFR